MLSSSSPSFLLSLFLFDKVPGSPQIYSKILLPQPPQDPQAVPTMLCCSSLLLHCGFNRKPPEALVSSPSWLTQLCLVTRSLGLAIITLLNSSDSMRVPVPDDCAVPKW